MKSEYQHLLMKLLRTAIAIEFLVIGCSIVHIKPKSTEIKLDPITITVQPPLKGVSEIINGIQHFRFPAEITPQSTKQFMADLSTVSPMVSAYIIDICSVGGEIPSGIIITKEVEKLGASTYCIVDGDGDSMALYFLQSCPVRIITKRSRLLLHGSRYINMHIDVGDKNFFQNKANDLRTTDIMLVEQYCQRMKPNKEDILAMIDGKDIWLDWEQAINIGAVDKVVDSYAEAEQLVVENWHPAKPPPPIPHNKQNHHKLHRRKKLI